MGGSRKPEDALPAGAGGMDVDTFLSSLLEALADRPLVRSVDLETEAIVVRGRVLVEQDRFLQVYFNEETGTTLVAAERITIGDRVLVGNNTSIADVDVHPLTPESCAEAINGGHQCWSRCDRGRAAAHRSGGHPGAGGVGTVGHRPVTV